MSAESIALRNLSCAIDELALINQYLAMPCAKTGRIEIRVDFSMGSSCNGAKEVKHELSAIVNEMAADLLRQVRKRAIDRVDLARARLATAGRADVNSPDFGVDGGAA